KRTLTPLPRSSTPNHFYNLITKKIKDTNNRPEIIGENCCRPVIKLDSLLYRPKTECYPHQNVKQTWAI
ncbi:unnamed protein product, partial [Adineta steineri]